VIHPVALGQEPGHLHLTVENALSAHLGRMCREHRAHENGVEHLLQGHPRHAGSTQPSQGTGDCAQRQNCPAIGLGAHAPNVLLIFGDVGEVRKIAERPYDLDRAIVRQAVEGDFEFPARGGIAVPSESKRILADALDRRKDCLALLLAHGFAKHPPDKANVVAQGPFQIRKFHNVHRLRGHRCPHSGAGSRKQLARNRPAGCGQRMTVSWPRA